MDMINFERWLASTDEYWLMAEAKKRNPKVRTYVLSWGVPGWIANGTEIGDSGPYFTEDNIRYQTSFVKGALDVYNISVSPLAVL